MDGVEIPWKSVGVGNPLGWKSNGCKSTEVVLT